jgi:hypothetical protein
LVPGDDEQCGDRARAERRRCAMTDISCPHM